jgi:tetratricopeptide (TPR) repeat protein
MSDLRWSLVVAVLVVSNVASVAFVLWRRDGDGAERRAELLLDSPRFRHLEETLAEVAARLDEREAAPPSRRAVPDEGTTQPAGAAPTAGGAETVSARLAALEESIVALRRTIEESHAARAAAPEAPDFAAADGYVHADALLESGKYATAADGYLKFLAANPDHPDYRDLAAKARNALMKAGYSERAIDFQKELIEQFPEHRADDLATLSTLEKESKKYDDAIAHLSESIDLTVDTESRLWRMMYRAWYVQLRDGDAAGLDAYRELDRVRQQLQVVEGNFPKKLAATIAGLEARVAGGPGG